MFVEVINSNRSTIVDCMNVVEIAVILSDVGGADKN